MTLLDRLKERIETDLQDGELTSILAEAERELQLRHGPPSGEITVEQTGARPIINLNRPLDAGEDIEIVEYLDGIAGETSTTLAADDYLILNGGRTLRRRVAGTYPRSLWGGRVKITYTPADESAQHEEAALKLAILAIEYKAASQISVGDSSEQLHDYRRERERIIAGIAPRRGLLMA